MPIATQPPKRSHESLQGIPYEDTTPAKPPVPIARPAKPHPNKTVNRLRRSRSYRQIAPPTRPQTQDETRRDSGIETSTSSARASRSTLPTDVESASSIRKSASLPSFRAHRESRPPSTPKTPKTPNGRSSKSSPVNGPSDTDASPPKPFMGILTEIPTGSFEDLTSPGQLEFSKRGSMLLGGRKAVAKRENIGNGKVVGSRRGRNSHGPSPALDIPSRVLSADEEALSNKVRSMYEDGGIEGGQWPLGSDTTPTRLHDQSAQHPSTNGHPSIRVIDESRKTNGRATPELMDYGPATERIHSILRQANELAGGIEDWEDVNNGDVDRYGFIVPRNNSSPTSSMYGNHSPDPPRMQRTSTLLQLASETPRRSRSRLSKPRSTKSPARSEASSYRESRFFRPGSSQSSQPSMNSSTPSKHRSTPTRLPHNKDRRCIAQAGDMLTLPPGLADIAEDSSQNSTRTSDLRSREWQRAEKWRKMATCTSHPPHPGGMTFTFDTRNPRLIERVWKGIPDQWRATAWHSFLSISHSRHPNKSSMPSDSTLKSAFHDLLDRPSPDDVQIDIDVPRTINSHIMFRRRYRGGQRLLFRVLHVMSIYFPDTGYVQGMAALAATLLCYFDEEMTFVMLVRLWQLRGLETLYAGGFGGLMAALEEFEGKWLKGDEVRDKLEELGIGGTSYGTRWYLTLFNYSIPFAAQLRVWDVFMLLGDPSPPSKQPPPQSSTQLKGNGTSNPTTPDPPPPQFNGLLDPLHAVSKALIDGMRNILMDSDFESAMKVLTSWVPVRDEECLMRVAKSEWEIRRRRGR